MRNYIFLICLLVSSALGIGYFAFSFKNNSVGTKEDRQEIELIKKDFIKKFKNLGAFSLSNTSIDEVELEKGRIEKIDSLNTDPDVFFSKEKCFESLNSSKRNFSDGKAMYWERYRCGGLKDLDDRFFASRPFLHPSGYSYAFLFYKFQGDFNLSSNWIYKNLRYMAQNELQEVEKKFPNIPSVYKLLSALSIKSFRLLIKSESNIISDEYVFFLDWDIFNFFDRKYYVFLRKDFEKFLELKNFRVSSTEEKNRCLFKDGNLCWNFSLSYLVKRVDYSRFGITLVFFLFMLFSLFTITDMMKKQKKADGNRRLALRVLSHELRTPISSMLVRLEGILDNFDGIDEENQSKILRVFDDAQRLRRLTEMSRNYLTTSNNKKNIQTKKILSLNEMLMDLEELYPEANVIRPENDYELVSDKSWLTVCIKNLIENALRHGEAPVKLFSKMDKGKLLISIQNSGKCEFDSLSEMTKEFNKGSASEGTGLGLNIVASSLNSLGHGLRFEKDPITFSICFKKDQYEKIIIS